MSQDKERAVRYAQAAQELIQENKDLKSEIAILENRIHQLEKIMDEDVYAREQLDDETSVEDANQFAKKIILEASMESSTIQDQLSKGVTKMSRLLQSIQIINESARKEMNEAYDMIYNEIVEMFELIDRYNDIES